MARLVYTSVSNEYAGADGLTSAVRDVDLTVEPGESVAIIGPSGCGKSTLLMMAAGLLTPSAGSVQIDGEDVTAPRRTTALIPQDLGLLPWKTVQANVELGMEIRKVDKVERAQRAARALATVGLADQGRKFPAELSGGMRQRVAFARALAADADLLLMDEPLSALDAISREELQSVLLTLQKDQGYSSVLVTHSIDEAVFLGSRIVIMTKGPGRIGGIVENPGMGTEGYRSSEEFIAVSQSVRALLEQAIAEGEVPHE